MPTGLTPQGIIATRNEVWNPSTLTWEPMQQPIIEGGTVVVGTVDQGNPNAGGALAWPVDVQATVGLTDAELRASPVVISGAVVTI